MKETILISGISGFLGSHIAEKLATNYNVVGIIRKNSTNWRLKEISLSNISFIESESENLEDEIITSKPSTFIHCAWQGIAAKDRDNWREQPKNFEYTTNLLSLTQKAGIKKFISLGSQAEYGFFTHAVKETEESKPFSAYGATKLATMHYCNSFCEMHDIKYYWLRLFPLYGIREDTSWFIPLLINNALTNTSIDLTKCEQEFGYLHTSDFVEYIDRFVSQSIDSGIYNITTSKLTRLNEIVTKIGEVTNNSRVFKVGVLNYRENQVMQLYGSTEKLISNLKYEPQKNMDVAVLELVNYYKEKINV